MKKANFKKLAASVLALSAALNMSGATAMITPPAETGVIKADDYEGELVVKLGDVVTLADGNKVAQPKQAQGSWSQVTVAGATAAAEDIVISFDAMAEQTTDAYQMFVRRTTNDENSYRGYCDFAGIEFSEDGTIRRNGDGSGALNAVYGVSLGNYNANQWYSIDMVIEGVASTSYQTTVKYYIDGVLVDTLDASAFKDLVHPTTGKHYQSDATVTGIFAGSDDEVTDGKMYFDNVKIYKADADTEYYAYADVADGKIDIEFSETPAGSMSGAVIKANDGTEIATTVTQQGRKMTAVYDKSALKGGMEYTLVLPANESVTGKELANNVVVFTTARADLNNILYIAEHDFDDWADTATGAASINATYSGCPLIPSSLVTDATGTGKAFKISYPGVGVGASYLIAFKNGDASSYQWNKIAGLNEFITELDIKAPELTQVAPEFVVFGPNDHHMGRFTINKNGYFIASTALNTNNNALMDWGIVDGTNEELNTNQYKAVKTTPGQWYNVKVGVIPATKTVRYYFDNELIAEYVNPRIAADTIVSELRIRGNDWGKDDISHETEIDNVKFGWAVGDAVLENTAGTTVAATNVQPANGGWGVQNVRVEILSTADAEASELANGAAIISADITLDTVSNNLMPAIYNAKGDLIATFWILNENGDVYIQPEAQNHIGKDTDGDGKYAFETGTATVAGAFKPGVATNVTAYINASRTYVYLFLDGMFVQRLECKWLQGVTSNIFDFDADGTVENFEMLPARIGVRMLEGCANEGNVSIKNVKLSGVDNVTVIESIRLKSANDEYSIHSSNISNQLTAIEINYNNDVASAPAVTLANAEGVAVNLGTATVSENTVTIPVAQNVLANGTYTLTIADTAYTFVIDCDMSLVISDFEVTNVDGDVIDYIMSGTEYYANVNVINPTPVPQNVTLIIATYRSGILEDLDFVSETLESGESFVINEATDENVTLTSTSDTTEVRAYLWDGFENAVPYKNAIEIVK